MDYQWHLAYFWPNQALNTFGPFWLKKIYWPTILKFGLFLTKPSIKHIWPLFDWKKYIGPPYWNLAYFWPNQVLNILTHFWLKKMNTHGQGNHPHPIPLHQLIVDKEKLRILQSKWPTELRRKGQYRPYTCNGQPAGKQTCAFHWSVSKQLFNAQ